MDPEHSYRAFALAYVRGVYPDLRNTDDDRAFDVAQARGLKLHRFKRTAGLPRVRAVLGALKGFRPGTLVDIGTGRGAFLWPLLDELPEVDVVAVDLLEHRVEAINAAHRGGLSRVRAEVLDAEHLPFGNRAFDAATVLEVLEHVENPPAVARQLVRVAKDVVIASVPAKEDNNPEHIRLFTPTSLTVLFEDAGAAQVHVQHVLNHMVAVVRP